MLTFCPLHIHAHIVYQHQKEVRTVSEATKEHTNRFFIPITDLQQPILKPQYNMYAILFLSYSTFFTTIPYHCHPFYSYICIYQARNVSFWCNQPGCLIKNLQKQITTNHYTYPL